MRGSCRCNNIEVCWHTVDYSLIPRACQCDYCLPKNAAYVSKSGTRVGIVIHNERQHEVRRHGSGTASFHECSACAELVFVTADIDGDLYCALNAKCLSNPAGFSASVEFDYDEQTVAQKTDRWRRNWCRPVSIRR
jgi:hypothetical protein